MLRNNLSNVTSADRFDHPPSSTSISTAPAAGGNHVSTKSPYTNLMNDSQLRPTSHIIGALTPPVKMCLAATFAILFLLVAFSFALEEYSDGDQFKMYSGSGGGPMIKTASARNAVPRHQAFSRSAIEKVEAEDELMDPEDDGMASSGGTTLGSDLLAKIEQNLESNSNADGGAASVERMLVYSGQISLKSPRGKVDEIADKISSLISKEGYIEDRSESFITESYGRSDTTYRKTLRMQLRVPRADFHLILDQIQSMVQKDHILSMSSQSRDVTDEYIDATARADTLSASRDALRTILSRANSVKDVMAVKTELNSMTEQIESHQRRAVYLKKQSVSCDILIRNYMAMEFSY